MALNAAAEAFPPTSAQNSNTFTTSILVVGAVGATQASSSVNFTVSLSNPNYAPPSSQLNLPIVNINTAGQSLVNNGNYVPGTITITSADGQTSFLPNASDTDTTANIEVHGNTTAQMPKLPYKIKLNTSLDLLTQMGLACPYVTGTKQNSVCDKSKSYLLLANYDDKTLLRDWSASALANAIPYTAPYLREAALPSGSTGTIPTPSGTSNLLPWAPHSLFVELYLNGSYEGTYQLIEDVGIDSHRVNITSLTGSSTDVTGGYLLDIDHHYDEAYNFSTPQGLPIGVTDPSLSPEIPGQMTYISNYVSAAENALFSASFTDPTTGWRAYFDEASAINFYLVNDIMGNVDGGDFYSSNYLYKPSGNPYLYMGPVWDFDISAGNVNYYPVVNPTVPWMQTQAAWYAQWFQDPAFKADVIKQFNALKSNGILTSWLASIQTKADALSQAEANNFQRWPILGTMVWPNAEAAGSYAGEVTYFLNYVNLRINYLDSLFNVKSSTSTQLSGIPAVIYNGSSVQLSATVNGVSAPTGYVYFLQNNVVIDKALIQNGVASLTTVKLAAGSDLIQAVYGGDTQNSLSESLVLGTFVSASPVSTITSLVSSDSVVSAGKELTFTVSVVGSSGSNGATGAVAFLSNGVTIGSASLNASGRASFVSSVLQSGTDVVQAVYMGDASYAASTSNSVSIVVNAVAADPTVSPIGGTYAAPLQVSLSDTSAGAAIYYTLDGTVPTSSSTLSVGSIALNASTTVRSVAVLNGVSSMVVNAAYILVASPVASPQGGTYAAAQQVTLSDTSAGASLFYTLDGSAPTSSSTLYTGPITIGATATLRAIAVLNGVASYVSSTAYTVIPTNTSVDNSSGFTAGSLALNGSAALSGTSLQLTDGKDFEAASAFSNTLVNVQAFTNDFTFQLSGASADGFMFVLQNQGLTALGAYGGDLGYGEGTGGIQKSVAIKFDLYSNDGEGADSTGLFTAGARPTLPSTDLTSTGLNLHSGNPIQAHMTYDGSTLQVLLTDSVTGATATQSYTVNIPALVGSNAAYAGFTAGTGGLSATQNILTWKFASGTPFASPVASPQGGTYAAAQQVTLSDTSAGASLFYTLDGSAPTSSSTLYTGPITIGATATLRAIAVLNGVASYVSSTAYTVIPTNTSVDNSSGFTAGSLALNGSAALSGTSLQLTDGKDFEAASAFSNTLVNVQAFTNDFTFQLSGASADGFMFVLQNQGLTALGAYGGDLGYGEGTGGIQKSVAIKFDLYSNDGEGADSTGLFTAGARPTLPSTDLTSTGLNLHSGNIIQAHMTYDGSTLQVLLTDSVTGATATQSYTINIPALVGSNAAYAGFTAGTGGLSATQNILTWKFASGTPFASPVASPQGGTYAAAQQVTLSDTSAGASLFYTLDGSVPTSSSTLYTGPITIGATATLRAIAVLNGVASYVSSTAYTVIPTNTSVDDSSGFTAGSLALNGSAALSGTTLQLTDGKDFEAASAFSNILVNVQAFTNDFTFQLSGASADGFMFVLQNQGLTALGAYGGDLGYGEGTGGIQKSVAIKFDLYSNDGEGADSTGLFTAGARPTLPSTDLTSTGLNLHSGNIIQAHMTYDGSTLQVLLTDSVTGATATQSYTVNIPALVGSNAAYAGFTAGTGGLSATQNILTWKFASGTPFASPVASPQGGTYAAAQQVTLSDTSADASLFYTLDGSVPTSSSTLYTGPITIGATATLRAIAVLNGVASYVSSTAYTIVPTNTSVDNSSGFTAGSLALNGSAALSGTTLQLTKTNASAGSAFWTSLVNVQAFTNDFTFQLATPTSDGITFVLQNQGLTALGAYGGDLGYGEGTGGIQKSVAIKFDLHDNDGEGTDSTGLFTAGARPTLPSTDLTSTGLNLHSGNIIQVHMTYDGSTLQVLLTDSVTGATATQSYTVNIPALVGSNAAYAGFTAGTGATSTTQNILTWKFASGTSK